MLRFVRLQCVHLLPALLLFILPAKSQTVSFQQGINGYSGARDATIRSDAPVSRFGSSVDIQVDGFPDVGALLKWDLAAIPPGSTIKSVTIELDVTNGVVSGNTYHLYEAFRSWKESETTWNVFATGQNWQLAGARGVNDRGSDVLGIFEPLATGKYSVSLNSAGRNAVQSWVNNPQTNRGFVLSNYDGPTDGITFRSKEFSVTENRPKLTIGYDPPDGTDIAPVASFTANPETGPAPLQVDFDASASADPDGTITSYIWDYGDGGSPSSSGSTPSYTYDDPGTYTVALTVTDDDGLTDVTTVVMQVLGDGDFVEFAWSGAVGPESAVVKARLTNNEAARLVVATDSLFANVTNYSPYDSADLSLNDRVVNLPISDLAPSTRYYYRLEQTNGTPSDIQGSFKTAPALVCTDPYTLKVAVGGDATGGSNAVIFDAIREQRPDLLIHVGDMHYSRLSTTNVDEYRSAYKTVMESPRQSLLYRNVPLSYVWDDNDFGPNDSDSTHVGRSAAKQAFREYLPHHELISDDASTGIYRAFSMGRVRFIVTDNRFHKAPKGAFDNSEKTLLGETQKAWFKQELVDAVGTHELIVWVNSIPWISSPVTGADHWGGYTTERAELADFFADNGINDKLVAVSADVHMAAIDDGSNSGYASGANSGGFPVFQAAPFDRPAGYWSGPYSLGASVETGQYGILSVTDNCTSPVTVNLTAYDDENDVLESSTSFPNGDQTLSYEFTPAVMPNAPPAITAIADQTILEDASTGQIAFTVSDAETDASALVVTATSSDPVLLPEANLVLGGSGENRTITATPVADAHGGPVTVTLTVDDGLDQTTGTFDVTVTAVNDAPSFAAGDPPAVEEGSGAQTVAAWASFDAGPDDEDASQSVLAYLVSSVSNPALFSAGPAVDAAGTLTYTPATGMAGNSSFTVRVQDDGGTANGGIDTSGPQTFTITVATFSLPVELTSFVAQADGSLIIVSWTTASEDNNSGFEVEHRRGDGATFEAVQFVAGQGTTNDINKYSVGIANLGFGKHTFRLRQIDLDGTSSYSDEVEIDVELTDRFALVEVWPNPFNPAANIRVSLRKESEIELYVYDVLGRHIRTLASGDYSAGSHDITFTADNLPNGTYVYRLRTEAGHITGAVLLLK